MRGFSSGIASTRREQDLDDTPQTVVKAVPSISAVAAADWDACANPDPATYNPFLSHAFLKALEDAGTVGQGTGWIPHHLVLEGPDATVLGVMPLYAVIARENFPLRMMGTVIGGTAMAGSLGMALGPVAGGLIYDTFASYTWLYVGSWGIGIGAFLIAMTFRPAPKGREALAAA